MARIASTVADLIGGTPLVRINHVAGLADVVAKAEPFNPASPPSIVRPLDHRRG